MTDRNIDKLLEDILSARKEKLIKRIDINNLKLVLNLNTFKELRDWYQKVMSHPIESFLILKKEYSFYRVFGMDIELRNIEDDFIVEEIK